MFKIILLLTTLVCINQIYGQTFQYSRGWTNGKRSDATKETPGMSLRQMIPNSLLLTANELNNRERLFQHILKNPCDVRMALLLSSRNNLKLQNEEAPAESLGNSMDDDAVNRFKRALEVFP